MLLIPLSLETDRYGEQTECSGSNGLDGDKLGGLDADTSEL